MKNKLYTFWELALNRLLFILPNFPRHRYCYGYFEFIRQAILNNLLKEFGKNSFVRSKVLILNYKNISIGSNCLIGPDSILNGTDKITLGNYFLSGPGLIIYTSDHGLENNGVPFTLQKTTSSEVIVGENVYLGARVTILKGVQIGDNVIVAAGSVITKDIPSNELWGGVPAKKIKNI